MTYRLFAGIACLLLSVSPSYAVDLDRPEVAEFIESMIAEHDYDPDAIRSILSEAEMQSSIIEQISKPAEKTLTWAEYRPIFLTKARVRAGASLMRCLVLPGETVRPGAYQDTIFAGGEEVHCG